MAKRTLFGIAQWIFQADTDPLKKSAKEAEQSVDDVGKKSEEVGAKVEDSFTKAGNAIESKTEGVRKFAGAIGSTVGVVTGLLGAVTLVSSALLIYSKHQEAAKEKTKQSRDGIEAATRSIEDFADATFESLRDVNRAQDDILDTLTELDKTTKRSTVDQLADDLKLIASSKRREAARKREIELAIEADEIYTRGIAERLAAEESFAAKAAQLQREQLQDERDRIVANADFAIKEAERVRKETGVSADDPGFTAYIEGIEKGEQIKFDELERREKQERKNQEERLRKEADSMKKASEEAARRFADELFGATSQTTTLLSTIVSDIQGINSAVGRR